jgi:ABC-type transport system involved in multi-copper enzyme maturation permease subunit
MTTTTNPATGPARATLAPQRPVTGGSPTLVVQFGRVLTSEWTKLRSVRSTVFTLLAMVLVCVGLGGLLAWGMLSRWDHRSSVEQAAFVPSSFSLNGLFLGQLVIGVLGVLVISAEYSSGTIRATLSAVPQRPLVLVAKSVVFAITAYIVAQITCLLAFFLVQAILSQKHIETHLTAPGVPRVVFGGALFLTAVGLLGLGLGALLRHTAAAISTLFTLMLVLPILSNFMPDTWQANVDKYLPLNAGQAVFQLHTEQNAFSPWAGIGVLAGYALIALVAGGVMLSRRDA